MDYKDRVIISGVLIAVAAVFVALTSIFSSDKGLLSSTFFTYLALFLAVSFVVIALYMLCVPNYLPGGFKNLLAFLPICKEKLISVYSICARCIGFPIGVIVSAFLSSLVFFNGVLSNSLMNIDLWILICLAVLANTPTAIHGYNRRIFTPTRFDGPLPRFLMGLSSGLGFFIAFLGWLKFLNY